MHHRGIPFSRTVVCEANATCRKFLTVNHAADIEHQCEDMESYAEWVSSQGPSQRPDIMVGGPSCQPFTQQRSNRKTCTAQDHLLFDRVFGQSDSYLSCLEHARPLIAILEEVKGFTSKSSDSQLSGFDKFKAAAQQVLLDPANSASGPLYVAIKAFILEASIWLDVSRPRVYVLLVTAAAGGERGAREIEEAIKLICAYRANFKPSLPRDLFAAEGLTGEDSIRPRAAKAAPA